MLDLERTGILKHSNNNNNNNKSWRCKVVEPGLGTKTSSYYTVNHTNLKAKQGKFVEFGYFDRDTQITPAHCTPLEC
jgi:hypothetical protein